MSGFEMLAEKLGVPIRWRGDKLGADGVTCPSCDEPKLGIDYAEHRDNRGRWIVKVWCRCGDMDIYRLAEAVGMTNAEIDAGNETLGRKYRRPGRRPPPSMVEVDEWHRALLVDRPKLAYVTRRRGVSRGIVDRYRIGHDGQRYTLPVFDYDAPFDSVVNLRQYLPNAPEDKAKMLSLTGSGTQLYTPVPDEGWVVIAEGEWDALRALSLGIPTVTNTAGASTWRDEWTERIGRRHVFVVYDRDNGGKLGEARVRESFERVGRHRSLTIVRLPLPYREKHGADLSDYLADHSAERFQSLLRRAYAARHARSPGRSRDLNGARPIATAKRRSGEGS